MGLDHQASVQRPWGTCTVTGQQLRALHLHRTYSPPGLLLFVHAVVHLTARESAVVVSGFRRLLTIDRYLKHEHSAVCCDEASRHEPLQLYRGVSPADSLFCIA